MIPAHFVRSFFLSASLDHLLDAGTAEQILASGAISSNTRAFLPD
jgi:hypothetical protein